MPQPRLTIPKPCPASLARMKNLKSEFHCKACDRNIVDFRGMSTEEILEVIQKGACGIFTKDQLTHQSKLRGYRKLLFGVLSILSFLGFSVSPVSAQVQFEPEIETDTIEMEVVQEEPEPEAKAEEPEEKVKKKRKRRRNFRRRRYGSTLGCIDF